MIEEKCENCRFWKVFSNFQYVGNCKRYPPVFVAPTHLEIQAGECIAMAEEAWTQPVVEDDGWCGEWKPMPIR